MTWVGAYLAAGLACALLHGMTTDYFNRQDPTAKLDRVDLPEIIMVTLLWPFVIAIVLFVWLTA